jgi:hypothetical protein
MLYLTFAVKAPGIRHRRPNRSVDAAETSTGLFGWIKDASGR